MKQKKIELHYRNIKPNLCWKIICKTKTLRYTDYSVDVNLNGEVYLHGKVTENHSFEKSSEDKADNYGFKTYFDDADISFDELTDDEFEQAEVNVFMINPSAPDESCIMLQKGYIKEIKIQGSEISFEVEGLLSRLSRGNITKCYSASCRASFGDKYCKIDKKNIRVKSVITKILDLNSAEIDISSLKKAYFEGSALIDETTQKTYRIKKIFKNEIYFDNPSLDNLTEDGEITILPSCNKEFATCCNIYNNAINFRGEPHLPGVDELLKTAGTIK